MVVLPPEVLSKCESCIDHKLIDVFETSLLVSLSRRDNPQVAVMTTEVFRNMLYDSEETGELEDVFAVVFDEFHYMNDRDRGTVSCY